MSVTRSPTMGQVLSQAIEDRLLDVHTSMPGEVIAYSSATQTATIRPLIRHTAQLDDGKLDERLPSIPNVPIVFPRAGDFFMSFPIAVGDTVLLVFCETPLDQWRAKDRECDPQDFSRHALKNAVAIPGVYASARKLSSASATDMVLGDDDGSTIHIKPNGEIHLGSGSASDFVAQAAKVLARLNAIVTAFNAHTHSVPALGTSLTPTTPMSAPASVAADKVKAD